MQAGTKQLCRAGLGLGEEKKIKIQDICSNIVVNKVCRQISKASLNFEGEKEKKTLNPTWSAGGSRAHCRYLDIYISQKIRFFKGNFKQLYKPKVSIFWSENSDLFFSFFFFFFWGICPIHCFLHTVAAIPKRWHVCIAIWCKSHNSNMSTLWNSSNSV